MVANLPELHYQVHERASRIGITEVRRLGKQVGNRDVSSKDLVQLPLPGTEIDVNVNLNLELRELQDTDDEDGSHLLAQLVLDMFLDTAQHERFQDHMQSAKLMFVELVTLVLRSILDVLREPLVELVMRIEETRHDEMQ